MCGRRAHAQRRVHIRVSGGEVTDALTEVPLALVGDAVELDLGAGAFRLLRVAGKGD